MKSVYFVLFWVNAAGTAVNVYVESYHLATISALQLAHWSQLLACFGNTMLDRLDAIANKLLPYATAVYAVAQYWRIFG